MSFSKEWESEIWSKGEDTSWPWSDVVSLFFRHTKGMRRDKMSVLEIGIGTGANYPFFKELGITYSGVEGSKSAIERVYTKFPELKEMGIHCEDFTSFFDYPSQFDLILDRSSLICNELSTIQKTLPKYMKLLKNGGRYMAIDWFGIDHSSSTKNETHTAIGTGHLENMGKISFVDEAFIKKIAEESSAKIIHLEKKTREDLVNKTLFTAWDFILESK